MTQLPLYDIPEFPVFQLGKNSSVHMQSIVNFLSYVVERDQLAIDQYLEPMGHYPFFLVAATGLGKTVAVPVHVLIRQIQWSGTAGNPTPRVWVVEPRIPIAVDQCNFMNGLWDEFNQQSGYAKMPPLFGCKTSKQSKYDFAPVQFITTGVFATLTKSDRLEPWNDRFIIDEAHVTVEQNPDVELGIALARSQQVVVDYMSATVDTHNIQSALKVENIIQTDAIRKVVWRHNLKHPIDKAIIELVGATLIRADLDSSYYPQPGTFPDAHAVREAVSETDRSHGMLAIVNSHAGHQSDTARLAAAVRSNYPDLPVLQLASEVIRDPRKSREFERRLADCEAENQNYLILSTSVVEMGITFPNLDYVVSMDSGYDQETIGNKSIPVVAPLGVNSLLQRMGRVGRRRPGIAYVACEVDAEYSRLDDEQLNSPSTLTYEPISFPLASAPLMPLAYYICQQEWQDVDSAIAGLDLPSHLHENSDRMEYLKEQIDELSDLGLADGVELTPLGKRMETWIGRADLAYTIQLQKRFEEGADFPEVLFWVTATALSEKPISSMRAQFDYFVDHAESHTEIPHHVTIWAEENHEDLAAFEAISQAIALTPTALLQGTSGRQDQWDYSEFACWCGLAAFDPRKLVQAIKGVEEIWKIFCKINGPDQTFTELFGDRSRIQLADLPWSRLAASLPHMAIARQLRNLPGGTTIRVEPAATGSFAWRDLKHGHTGIMSQDDTPLFLQPDKFSARVTPSRQTKESDTVWRPAHLGYILPELPSYEGDDETLDVTERFRWSAWNR
ncbi:helicase-related protein [Streptomyces sp. R08]|uniref:Helicase-related protein n=1 Tax=Streptomyces sp. R08 TaxID=3238624 RepID=A0AB39M0P6_9ACTN